jgi:hypothetical protein
MFYPGENGAWISILVSLPGHHTPHTLYRAGKPRERYCVVLFRLVLFVEFGEAQVNVLLRLLVELFGISLGLEHARYVPDAKSKSITIISRSGR